MISNFLFKIQSSPGKPPGGLDWRVPHAGGTIGRANACDWVLDDPDKLISRLHARVAIQQGQCFWTDLGTNPTVLNGHVMPSQQPMVLNNGDQLNVGSYSIALILEPEAWCKPNQDSVTPNQAGVCFNFLHLSDGPEASASQLHELLETCLRGYMRLLQARRIFRDEIGSPLTQLSAQGNNPLKTCQSASEALTLLLDASSPGHLPAQQALEQACEDLLLHMHSSVAHIQSLIGRVQSQLNPEDICREAERAGGWGMGLSSFRKARLWDLYCERYRSLDSTWS